MTVGAGLTVHAEHVLSNPRCFYIHTQLRSFALLAVFALFYSDVPLDTLWAVVKPNAERDLTAEVSSVRHYTT